MGDSTKKTRERLSKTSRYYVNGAELLQLVRRDKAAGKLSNELAKKLLLIAERYSTKSTLNGYTYREDMVAYAALCLCQNWHKFDADRYDNPLAYYTTCINNSFIHVLNNERTQRDIRDKLLVEEGMNASSTFMAALADGERVLYDSDEYIEKSPDADLV